METHSNWYNRIIKKISSYKDTLSKKDYKKYKLDLLMRVARRVDGFSAYCGQCQLFQQDITGLTTELGLLTQMPSKEGVKSYSKKISSMVKHLQKQHKLVSEGHYMGIGAGMGVAIGTALGAAMDNTGAGTGIGTTIGIAVGSYLDNKAKKEDRII